MRIEFVGHASILTETKNRRILSDPWWQGPCFGAQWWNYPRSHTESVYDKPIDYIYISHGHNDHYHPGTLRTLANTNATILVSDALDLVPGLRQLGFQVIAVAPDSPVDLGNGVRCWIMPTHGLDTLMLLTDDEQVCLNLNDSLHAAPPDVQKKFIASLKEIAPRIDYLFCGYGTASHFPNCYSIPGKDDAQTAVKRQKHFNRSWVRIVHGLAPRFGFPFAADVAFLEKDLQHLNEPVRNAERPTDVFLSAHPADSTRVIDIAPGFSIEDGRIETWAQFTPFSMDALQTEAHVDIVRANTYGKVSVEQVDEITDLLNNNIRKCEAYLREYAGSYTFVVRFRNSEMGICVTKRGNRIDAQAVHRDVDSIGDFDVRYTVRPVYLRRSLTEQYGDEVLFVGSGGIFEYRSRAMARTNLHRELKLMMTRQAGAPKSRFGGSGAFVYTLKRGLKRLLGIKEHDLYDLDEWVVFAG